MGLFISNNTNGPEEEELIGLNVEDRKRRRGGLESSETMDTE